MESFINNSNIPQASLDSGIYSLSKQELIKPIQLVEGMRYQYHSLAKNPRDIWDRLLPMSNIGFWYRYIQILVRGRKLALNHEFTDQRFFEFSCRFIEIIESYRGIFHITGIENLLKVDGPIVLAGNHMSVLETFVLPAIIGPQKKLTFVVKDSLVKNALFGAIMQSRDPIALRRINPREDFTKVMEEGTKRIDKGISVAIFPQATRDPVFKRSEFNSIATKLAKKKGVPLIPIALKTDFWLPGGLVKDLGYLQREKKIHISIGSAIPPELDSKKSQESLVDFIVTNLKYWGGDIQDN